MLEEEYQWETPQNSGQTPQTFDHYHNLFSNQTAFFPQPQQTHVHNIASLFDPQNYVHTPSYQPDEVSRIGLNLGVRTYFSSDDEFVNRLHRRSRPAEIGLVSLARCQTEGCNADLSHAKHYHRRHKVCEFHSKASTAIVAGLTQRFCQQCSRFHLLSEFDNGKRSCRKRLADHNRRRRKTHQPSQDNQKSQSSSSDNLTTSPPDSVARQTSSVTVAISPSQISYDCFPQRASPASSSSVF